MNEEDLLPAIAAGNQKAFESFYMRFKDRVYATAYSYLRQEQDAEEITQDVFIEIHRSAGHFNGKSAVNTWVYKIAVNKCLDRLRYQKAKKRFALLSFFGMDEHTANAVADATHHGLEADKKESLGILLAAIEKLPANQKTALILTQLELLKSRETAEIMGTTPKAVERLIQRGKQNLKKELEKMYYKRGNL